MTQLLEQAFERVRALPTDQQDALARIILSLAVDHAANYRLTAEEEVDLLEGEAEIARGEFATDADVETLFAKYRL